MGEGYATAQVCVNGHVIQDWIEQFPEKKEKFCSLCSAATITACPKCEARIRGYPIGQMNLSYRYVPPRFCHNCAEPFPWTILKLQAAKDLVNIASVLSSTEKEEFSSSLDDIVKDNPNAQVSAIKYKTLMKKAGIEVAQGVRDIVVDIISETIRRTLFGP